MPFIHIFKDPYKTSQQKSVNQHFQTFSSNLFDFYIVSFPSFCSVTYIRCEQTNIQRVIGEFLPVRQWWLNPEPLNHLDSDDNPQQGRLRRALCYLFGFQKHLLHYCSRLDD